ncbi:MAG TPA: M20/M25/M40 family metallo-hydrolase [Rhizomicrobium sp.]|nr:M20/M25/M40 family metallo-hydrolase [Rhizomicrobium sp.]
MGSGLGGLVRVAVLALVMGAIWWVSKYDQSVPFPRGTDAPADVFSAGRAEDVLARLLGPERPHPATSAENAAVRARILRELARLGVKATTYANTGCNSSPRYGVVECGTVTDVIGDAIPGPAFGSGKAIVLLAHYDSVPAGPGAADDESGVATVLETIRALKASHVAAKHPVMAVLTDGEEYGLLGAASFLDNPALKARVGAVINVEARGNQGQSLLFQTSPGDGPLVDLYARSVPHYATSSLFSVIYRLLPNDTDLTLFIAQGFTAFNFAFSDNVAHYHTPLDRRENLSTVTLQQHGDNMLGIAQGLQGVDFASLRGGHDDIYLTVMGAWLPRLPAYCALPLSLLAFAMLVLLAFLANGPMTTTGVLNGAAIPLAVILGAAALGWGLHEIAVLVSGGPDPSFAYPLALRFALAFGTATAVLFCARPLPASNAALAAWIWYAAFAIIAAIFARGLTPYFLFPALIAVPLLYLAWWLGWESLGGKLAFFAAALPALFIWLGLAAMGETVMGLALHPLFTVPAAIAALALLPLLAAHDMPRRAWLAGAAALLAAAVIAAVWAGTEPAYSAIAPQRLNVTYVEDHAANKAFFAADANAPLPAPMRAAAKFSETPERPYAFARGEAYVASAGAPRLPAPDATVTSRPMGKGRMISLALSASPETAQTALIVPRDAALSALTVNGKRIAAPPQWAQLPQVILLCTTRDCAHATVGLASGAAKPFDVTLVERRFGIPGFGRAIVAARPTTAVQSQLGDGTLILTKVRVP